MFARSVAMLAPHHYPNAVAEFEYKIGPWKEIGVTPTHMYEGELRNARDLEIPQRYTNYRRLGDEKAEIVQISAVPGDPARSGLPDEQACTIERLRRIACQSHDVILCQNDVRGGNPILVPLPD